MLNIPILAADFIGWIVPIVVIVFIVISHLWNAIQGSQNQQRRQQNQPRGKPEGERPLRPISGQQPAKPAGQSQLNAEIEQFLKRANERRAAKGRRVAKPQPEPARPPLAESTEESPRQRTNFDSVATSVQEHLGGRTFDAREAHMAEEISQADEAMERHLQQAFSHRLGSLEGSPLVDAHGGVPEIKPPDSVQDRAAAAKAVAGLLVNQQSIRQAVLLKEILERPVDRW